METLSNETGLQARPEDAPYSLVQQDQRAYHLPPGFWAGLFVLVAIAAAASYSILNKIPLGADEGLYITWARLLAADYRPYAEVYLTTPPLTPLLLQAVWSWWPSPTALKLVLLVIWAAGIVAVALISCELSGDWRAGLGTAALLAFSVQYFADSQLIIMTIASIVPGLWAIWLALRYQRTGRTLALVGSALLTAVSLEIKLFSPFLPVLVILVILSRHLSLSTLAALRTDAPLRRQILRVISIWGLALLLLPLLSLLFVDIEAMLRGAILQRLEARHVYPPGEDQNAASRFLKHLNVYVSTHRSLIVLALLGLGAAIYSRTRGRWLVLGWLVIAFLVLSIHTPLYNKHFVLLTAPLVLAAGFLFGRILQRPRHSTTWGLLAVFGLGLFGFGADFAGQLPSWQALAQGIDPPDRQRPAIAFIDEVTAPDDCLITDYSQLLLWTSRLPPPELSEVSSSRLRSGFLTTPELIDITETYHCQVVAPLTGRFRRSTLDYIKWVEGHYKGLLVYTDDKQILYFGKPVPEAAVAQQVVPYQAQFGPNPQGQSLELYGATPFPDTIRPGASIPIRLFWRPTQPLSVDYTIFVQLRNAHNVTVASADHQPYKGLLPFSRWPAGEIMPETSWLHLPPDLPPGAYRLLVGVYDQASLERLPLSDDVSGENALPLHQIQVQ